MDIDEVITLVKSFDGAAAFTVSEGDGSPELAWGDTFFYYAPNGKMPQATQPFATIVTKNYPEDAASRLDRPGIFRVNIAAGRSAFESYTAAQASETNDDAGRLDVLMAHPVYGSLGWLCVLNPGTRTSGATSELLREAYGLARKRYERRNG
ncbi:DUF6194 family protein [Arthrobacter tecti]